MRSQQPFNFPLLDRVCEGDRKALEDLIRFCGSRLHQSIASLCRDRLQTEIDDIYQATWLLLMKDGCRILRRYHPEKGDLGAFLFGVACQVTRKHQARQARLEVPVFGFRLGQARVCDDNLKQTIDDLFMRASSAERRFLRESLLQPPD